jgi:hypothetical protein
MTQKFNTGAFVFTCTRGMEPRDPADLEPVAVQHGIDAAFVPAYAGDRVTISRALTHASRGLQNEGFLLRPIRRTSSEVVYGVVREQRDDAQQRLDHDFEATISWSAEPDPGAVVGDHDVASRVRDAFNTLRGKIVADDWSSSITSYLESHDAARMRGDGRVYWVPPQRIAEVHKLSAFLAEVGIDLILCEIEPEVQTVVQDVAQVSIDEELDRLQAEAEAFDGKQKPSTYSRRLDEYQQLRQRAVLYRDALGVGADRAQAVLDELEKKVSAMLDLRRQTTIHRDGSISGRDEGVSSESETVPAQPVATDITNPAHDAPDDTRSAPVTEGDPSRAPVSIRFAGALFTLRDASDDVLTYTSDEAAAKSSAAALESMGLAGKWQQAGPVKISIQNSGPEGAAVSLRFQVPASQTLRGSATALSTWGIQLDS